MTALQQAEEPSFVEPWKIPLFRELVAELGELPVLVIRPTHEQDFFELDDPTTFPTVAEVEADIDNGVTPLIKPGELADDIEAVAEAILRDQAAAKKAIEDAAQAVEDGHTAPLSLITAPEDLDTPEELLDAEQEMVGERLEDEAQIDDEDPATPPTLADVVVSADVVALATTDRISRAELSQEIATRAGTVVIRRDSLPVAVDKSDAPAPK